MGKMLIVVVLIHRKAGSEKDVDRSSVDSQKRW